MARKNQARLFYKGQVFLIWQDDNQNWCYSFEDLLNVPTSRKELQSALNMVYETIEERLRPRSRKK
jgi:hypothetical protein